MIDNLSILIMGFYGVCFIVGVALLVTGISKKAKEKDNEK